MTIPNLTRGHGVIPLTRYLIEPKRDGPGSSVRLGFWHTENFCEGEADNLRMAARVMARTCQDAARLKAEAGIATTGRKATEPSIWHGSLSWNPSETVNEAQMMAAARDWLEAVGLSVDKGYQTYFVQHTDTAHPHLHVVVNLVHPITGKQLNPYRDKSKSQKWAHEYDKARGITVCHDRAAKYNALAAGRKPVRTPDKNPRNRAEWQARKDARAAQTTRARDEAAALRREYAARAEAIRRETASATRARQQAKEQAWAAYCVERDDIRKRYRRKIDAVMRHQRNPDAWPLTPTGWRDWRQTREWKSLGRRLRRERDNFMAREKTAAGRLTNAIALTLSTAKSLDKGRWSTLFGLSTDPAKRREFLQRYEATVKASLADKHRRQRRNLAEPWRAAMQAELAKLSQSYRDQAAALREQAGHARHSTREQWRMLATDRWQGWDAWRARYQIPDRKPDLKLGRAAGLKPEMAGSVTVQPPANDRGRVPPHADGKTAPPIGLHWRDANRPPDAQQARQQGWEDKRNAFRENAADITAPADAWRSRVAAEDRERQVQLQGLRDPAQPVDWRSRVAEQDQARAGQREQAAERPAQGWKERGKDRAPRQRDRTRERE